jgi:hypothetical protein
MNLVEPTRELLQGLGAPLLTPFLAQWPDTTRSRQWQPPASQPVTQWLTQAIAAAAPSFSRTLVTALASAAPAMTWKQTYTAAQVSEVFLQNYAWSELIASERLACGFLLLGPHTLYPRHNHEPEEIYIPLLGTAAWEKGNEGWREQRPGTVIHHPSYVQHAMRTADEPLVALYLWRGDNLGQKARLLAPNAR